jgi:glycosyltransferase involved in cell wall biosynthesis
MKCRILYLAGQLSVGGQERQLYHLLQGMNRERYRPAVAVWSFRENDEYVSQIRALGVPLHSLGPTRNIPAKLNAFRRLVAYLKPEVVHSYCFWTNFAASWATWGRQVVAFGSMRSNFQYQKQVCGPWLGRVGSAWPRNHIFNNFAAAENARCSKGLFVPRQIYVVRNGLDLKRFCKAPLPTAKRVRIVAVGSLEPIKRWDKLITAAAELKQRGLDLLLQIAGNGSLKVLLEQQAEKLGLSGSVEFIGHSSNIPKLLADAIFLAHTSETEGCPNVVMEAMACGRAVVATDVGDVPDLVEHGKTGFVVRRTDDAMLVECMVKLITDRDLCRRMGEAGRAKAEREFGLDRLACETLAAYRAAGWEET